MLTVVTGPPCSGKSTYVRDRAARGDIVVDFDPLAETLGSPTTHGHGSRHVHVALAAWRAAVAAAIRTHDWGHTVWVVDSQPSDYRLRQYERAGATIVHLDAEAEVLHERARQAGRPDDTHQRITAWAGPSRRRSRSW